MITLPSSVRIYLAVGAVDLRKSIDGLGAIVSERGHDLYSGHLYVFLSRRGDRLKILTWSAGGGPIAAFDPMTQLPSGVHLSFFASAYAFGTPDVPLSRIPFQQFADDAARGVLQARPAHVFEFADIVAAHQLMESGEARGKIVVRAPEE